MRRPIVPRTYDEITRHTVPEPDSSFRPAPELERDAYAHFHSTREGERELYQCIKEALLVAPDVATSGVVVEVDQGRVTLRGHVLDPRSLRQVETMVTGIEGVTQVDNRLIIATE